MREIVFRGKRRDTGEWVEGYFVHCKSEWEEERVAEIIPPETDRIYRGEYDLYGVHEVDPETVGQFTGMTDKNGKRIFEGDTVKYDDGSKTGKLFEIVWGGGAWLIRRLGTQGVLGAAVFHLMIEVIGNIHDNPELIGGRENNG